MAALTSHQLSEQIDQLFEQYLGLLDQYDSLRKKLSVLQASTLQNIARANFEAPRGTRYGEDLYDARIQATRLCCVTKHPDMTTTDFTLSTVSAGREQAGSVASEDTEGGKMDEEDTAEGEKATKTKTSTSKDPIRMFGILNIPSSLRVAQSEAVNMLDIVPKLVSVDSQMKEIEIQIRRARKHRTRTEITERASKVGMESVTSLYVGLKQ